MYRGAKGTDTDTSAFVFLALLVVLTLLAAGVLLVMYRDSIKANALAQRTLPSNLAKLSRGCGFYLLHLVAIGITTFLLAMFVAACIGAVNQRVGDFLFEAPLFPGEIILGFCSGFVVDRFLGSSSAKWTWVVPALLLLSDFLSSIHGSSMSSTSQYFFAGKCSDCVEVMFMVAPFYTSIAYSLGAWAALKYPPDWRKRAELKPKRSDI